MAVIKSNVAFAKVDIELKKYEIPVIKLNDVKVEGVKGFYLSSKPNSFPSLLIDINVDKLNITSNNNEIVASKTNLNEVSVEDLLDISMNRLINEKVTTKLGGG